MTIGKAHGTETTLKWDANCWSCGKKLPKGSVALRFGHGMGSQCLDCANQPVTVRKLEHK